MDKPSRPVRNRKRSRRAWPPGDNHRPVKRLFTPEIKRMLKDWLVRRRENPYPNREEKKQLAVETGLTYTQICNWFANWRRKLKNSGSDPMRNTWGNLIKNYNTNARGNVEQFSICSDDSIWGENGEDTSQGSQTPPSGERPYHHHHHRGLHHNHRSHDGAPYVKYGPKLAPPSYATMYDTYIETGCAAGDNNNSDSCRNNNSNGDCGKYIDYMRLSEYSRVVEDCPTNEDVRDSYPPTTFCFDHCYTPRNYETVFGIPEETRCYKVTQIGGNYDSESGATIEPLILTATSAHYGRPFSSKEEYPHDGTLYLTPTTTLSSTGTPAIGGGRSRSSKYKSSIMEKYLRDLGELEPVETPADAAAVVPVLMAAIPFQQKHCPRGTLDIPQASPTMEYEPGVLRGPPSLSKWLESAAKFTPSKHNYIDWEKSGKQSSTKKRCDSSGTFYDVTSGASYSPPLYSEPRTVTLEHQKDELDAAEALTRLANNCRTKFST
uniref:Homeobox domain-containing protein n=1 Tax=Anopheles farauti TaxID=69004 RepID=A0A182QHE4_9DIPT